MGSIKQLRADAGGIRRRSGKLLAYTLLVAGVSSLCVPARAQTFAEWWSQKKTQKKYLIQQIAALQVYSGYLQKGYEIARSGLSTIKGITKGEFGLHTAYLNSLKQVNPVIREDKRVDLILTMQTEMLAAWPKLKAVTGLSADNAVYVSEVTKAVLTECGEDLDELALVITAGKLELTDDERLERLGKVYGRTLNKYAFTQSFTNDVVLVAAQAAAEQRSLTGLRRYYEKD